MTSETTDLCLFLNFIVLFHFILEEEVSSAIPECKDSIVVPPIEDLSGNADSIKEPADTSSLQENEQENEEESSLNSSKPNVSEPHIQDTEQTETNAGSPHSHTGDLGSTHDSDIATNEQMMMDISIKVNVGSPLLTQEQCLVDQELEDELAENTGYSDDTCKQMSESTKLPYTLQDDFSTSPKPSVVKNESQDDDSASCEEATPIRVSGDVCSSGGSDRLNVTFTIESPERDIAEEADPSAALNESLTLSTMQFGQQSYLTHSSVYCKFYRTLWPLIFFVHVCE